MSNDIFEGFRSFMMKKMAQDPAAMQGGQAGVGGDMSGGDAAVSPAMGAQEVPPDPSMQGQEQQMDEETVQVIEYFKSHPEVIKALGGAQAIIQAVERAAGGGQQGAEQPAPQPENELRNKIEGIIGSGGQPQGQPGMGQQGAVPQQPMM